MSRICQMVRFQCQCVCTAILAISCMSSHTCVECISTATFRRPHVQTFRRPDVQNDKPCQRADEHTCRRAEVQKCRCPNIRTCKRLQTYRRPDMKTSRRPNVRTYRRANRQTHSQFLSCTTPRAPPKLSWHSTHVPTRCQLQTVPEG